MSIFQVLFSTGGRIPRSKYWLNISLCALAYLVAFLFDRQLGTHARSAYVGLFSGIVFLFELYVVFVASVKRCHDLDRSGWFLLLGLIPLINLWLVFELGFRKGTTGKNRFGADPVDAYVPTTYSYGTGRTIVCSHCGGSIRPDAVICRHCGRSQLETDGSVPLQETRYSFPTSPDPGPAVGEQERPRETPRYKTCLNCLHTNIKEATTCEYCGERFVPRDSSRIFRDKGWGNNLSDEGGAGGSLSIPDDRLRKPSYFGKGTSDGTKTCLKCLHSNPSSALTCEHCGVKF